MPEFWVVCLFFLKEKKGKVENRLDSVQNMSACFTRLDMQILLLWVFLLKAQNDYSTVVKWLISVVYTVINWLMARAFNL